VKQWKEQLKPYLPRPIHQLYNRIFSRSRIRKGLGDWFDLDWKRKALQADTRTWKDTYDLSWENWRQEDLSAIDIERLRAGVGQPRSLLDAGCGDGYLLHALRPQGTTLFGADLSGTGLRRARQRLGVDVHFAQCFLENLPFADRAMDVVVCAHTLEHVKNLDQAIAELKRITRHTLIILVPSQEYLPYTQDYHLHFFPKEVDLLRRANIAGARCDRYTVPPGLCAYQGDVLLLTADMSKEYS
jgi:ubiquinone/menaquinone biosynthesis C-methylase UbiE